MNNLIFSSKNIDELIEQIADEVVLRLKPNDAPTAPRRKLLTITEAAELTGIKKNTLYLYTSKGKIPHSKRANKLFFFEDDLINWIEESKRIINH